MTFPERGLVVAVTSNTSFADTTSIALKIAQAFAEQGRSSAHDFVADQRRQGTWNISAARGDSSVEKPPTSRQQFGSRTDDDITSRVSP